jgi:glycosyltransferase involved in cell wall biosynthesis
MRALVFLHDAFGGRGGIAKFNRDLLFALCNHPGIAEVVCLPRRIVEDIGKLPRKLDYRINAAKGAPFYLSEEARVLLDPTWFDLVICGHIRLMRLMEPLRLRHRCEFGMIIHGIDAWEPTGGRSTRNALSRLDWFVSVSEFTKNRFCEWSGLDPARAVVVPNAVDLSVFTPGPKRPDLVLRYGLSGRRVLMTMARLDEQYKGTDEVIELMPALLRDRPELTYVVCGEGTNRPRLEAKAQDLGVGAQVIFTGYVPEEDKVDYYRLADCFVLAGWGEGFGIVLVEAMSCGVPSVASVLDASAEAVDNGRMGELVNPKDPQDLRHGIEAALARPAGVRPDNLEIFSNVSFEKRIHSQILDPLANKLSIRL